MLNQIVIIVATAVLSAGLTTAGAYWLYRKRLRRELDEQLAAALVQLEERLQAALGSLGAVVEERVRQGVVKGVASLPSSDVLADTTRTVAKTGVELAGGALGALLGRRPRSPKREPPE